MGILNYPGPRELVTGERDDDPPIRKHCYCGAFLSPNPEEIERRIGPEPDDVEKDWVWGCNRCDRILEAWEMWK